MNKFDTYLPLSGKTAFITGAVRRIGRATALELASLGANIVINARTSLEEAESVAQEITATGHKALICMGDVRDPLTVKSMFAKTAAEFGSIDILINNASIRADKSIIEMTYEEWKNVTSIIIDGAFTCCKEVIPYITQSDSGRIINLGGVSAHLGAPNRAHVVTAKAAVVGLTRALAHELAYSRVTVNCVAPGKIGGERSATSGKGIEAKPILADEGEPADVAAAIVFLCLPTAKFITGQTIHVNGGMVMP